MGANSKLSVAIDRGAAPGSKSGEFFFEFTPISSRDMRGVNHSQLSISWSHFGSFTPLDIGSISFCRTIFSPACVTVRIARSKLLETACHEDMLSDEAMLSHAVCPASLGRAQ